MTVLNAIDLSLMNAIVAQFLSGDINAISSHGQGHINTTYKVVMHEDQAEYLLQQVNTHVFKDIPGLMHNIKVVTQHLQGCLNNKDVPFRAALTLVLSRAGQTYVYAEDKTIWRLYRFISGAKSYEHVTGITQATLAGKAFGAFGQCVANINPDHLKKTIAGFHELPFVLKQFKMALTLNAYQRAALLKTECQFIAQQTPNMLQLDNLRQKNQLPLRITHNDTKFNNVLFDHHDQVLCVVDYDTIMPGLIHHDYADAIRIIANTADEDEQDQSLIAFDMDLFSAFTEGFLAQACTVITQKELNTLSLAVPLMPFMLGIRFLTDYLNDNPYFHIDYPQHNLIRARAQFSLVKAMLSKMPAITHEISLFRDRLEKK